MKSEERILREAVEEPQKYFWSFDESKEVWYDCCSSIKDCIKRARETGSGKPFVFIGALKPHEPYLRAFHVLDILIEEAWDTCMTSAEGWLEGVAREEKTALEESMNELISEWLEKTNNVPRFGKIEDVYCYDLSTGERVEDWRL